MSSGLVGLHMKMQGRGLIIIRGNWLALEGAVSPLSVRPQMSNHQNKKVCLIHLALTFLSLWEVYGARCLTSGVS